MKTEISANLNPMKERVYSEKLAKYLAVKQKNQTDPKIQEVSRGLETLFVQFLLRAMRETVPETNFSTLSSKNERAIYNTMMDEQIAKNIAGRNVLGISDAVYRSIERIQKRRSSNPTETPDIFPLKEKTKPIPLEMRMYLNNNIFDRVERHAPIIRHASRKFDVDSTLIKAVIAQESGGNAGAVSGYGAKGLMQLIDGTAKDMGVKDVWNPAENIIGGTKYLRNMLDRFDDDTSLALAAYNAGPTNVSHYGGIPPFSETQNYIKKVFNYQKLFQQREENLSRSF